MIAKASAPQNAISNRIRESNTRKFAAGIISPVLQAAPCPCTPGAGMLAVEATTSATGFPMKAPLLMLAFLMITHAAEPVTTLANFPNHMVYAVQTDAAGNIYVAGFQGGFI